MNPGSRLTAGTSSGANSTVRVAIGAALTTYNQQTTVSRSLVIIVLHMLDKPRDSDVRFMGFKHSFAVVWGKDRLLRIVHPAR